MKFTYQIYQRNFKQPLRTNHGVWRIREGIIITLEDATGISKGEIAPLPWFGSETLSEALNFCRQLGRKISVEEIAIIPDYLPACQFAFESAWLGLSRSSPKDNFNDFNYCYLLPAGEPALSAWQEIKQQTATTFKWKIGVYSLDTEIEILKQLVDRLPATAKLRLDANGGLNLFQAEKLLRVTDTLDAIAFIEQPLSSDRFTEMMQLAQSHHTLLALDESVASYTQLKAACERGWQGVFVIKAAIMGFPSRLKQFCQQNYLDIVFSSVFETEVGRAAVLRLARELNHPRAVGFGIESFYQADDENLLS